MLTGDNLEKLVTMVNEELQSASCVLKDQLDVIDAELKDVSARLSITVSKPESRTNIRAHTDNHNSCR